MAHGPRKLECQSARPPMIRDSLSGGGLYLGRNPMKKLLKALNPLAWPAAVDRWMDRMDYQGGHRAVDAT